MDQISLSVCPASPNICKARAEGEAPGLNSKHKIRLEMPAGTGTPGAPL